MKNKVKTGYPSIDKTHLEGTKFFDRNPIIPNLSMYNTFAFMSKGFKDKMAVDSLDAHLTYDELNKEIVTMSKALKHLGIKSGDIISAAIDNYYQAYVLFFAANRIGATVTFLNSKAALSEIKDHLNEFESPLFLNDFSNSQYSKSIVDDTKVQQVITLNQSDVNSKGFNPSSDTNLGYSNFINYGDIERISEYQKSPFWTMYGGNQDALILFTSGTTGKPKSVVLTNKNILAAELYSKHTSSADEITDLKAMVCVPFCYPYGFVTSGITSLLLGDETIFTPGLDRTNISSYLKKEPQVIFGSPALLELIKRNVPENQDLSFVKHFVSGGDFLTSAAYLDGMEFFKKHGADVKIGNGYGNAETVSSATSIVGVPNKPETAGKLFLGIKPIIIDPETLEEKKYNEEGLLCVSGKHVFKGYFNNPELTKEVKFIKDGVEYYNTGTMGYIREDGYFVITGRQSRFYIMSTLNKVYLDYVQKVVSSLDCVKECAVVKVPDDELLYVNKAYISLNEGVEETVELKQHILEDLLTQPVRLETGEIVQLKPYEIPTYVEFVKELPRKPVSEKVDYSLLEENALNNVQKLKLENR